MRYSQFRLEARRGREVLVYRHRGEKVRLWGAKLTENLTQAVARDILASTLVRLEAAGVPVVMHVHDEVVAEVPESSSVESIEALMETRMEWAADLQLQAKVHLAKRYGK